MIIILKKDNLYQEIIFKLVKNKDNNFIKLKNYLLKKEYNSNICLKKS